MTSKRKVRNPLSVLRHRKKHPSNNNNNNNTTICRSNNKPRIYMGHDTNTYMSMPTTTNPSLLQVQFEKPSNSSSIVVLLEPRSSSSSSLGVATSCISKNHIINNNEKETAKTSCAANDENDNFIYNDENGEENNDTSREKSHNSIRFVVVEEPLTVEEEDDSVHSNTNNDEDEDEDDYKVLTPTKTTTCTTNSPFSPIQDVIKQTVFDLAGSYKEGHCLFYLTRLTRLLVNHQRESITEYSVSAPASSTTTTTTRTSNVQHMNIIEEEEEEEEEEKEDDDKDIPHDNSSNILPSSRRRRQKSLSATQSPFENNTTIHSTTSTEEETKTLIQVMIDNGLISTLISVMGRHHMNVHILNLSFKLLGRLGEHNEYNEIQIVQHNGIQIIIQTLSQHMTNHMLCLEACSTLYKVLHCISATHSSQKIVLRQMLITTTANSSRGLSHPHEELTSTSAREPSCSSQMKLKQSHTSSSTLVPDCTAGIEVLRRVMLLHMKHPSIQQHVLSILCLFAVMIMARNDWNHHHDDDQQQQQQQQHMTTTDESKALSSNSSIALSKLLISSMEDIALIEVIIQVMRRYGSSFFSNNTNCTNKRRTGNRLLSLNCGHYYSYHHHSQLVIQSSVLQLGNKLLHCLLLASKQRELTISKINNDIGRYYYGRRKDSNRTKALFFNDGYIRSSSKQLVQYLLRSRCCVLFLQIIHKHHEHITKSMKLLKNHDRPTTAMNNQHGENRRGGFYRTRSKTSDPLLILYTKDISTMKQSLDSIYILAEYNSNEVRKQLNESPVSVVTVTTDSSHRNDNHIDHQSQQQHGVTNHQLGLNIATKNQNRQNRRRYHHQHGVSSTRRKRKEMSGLFLLRNIASGNDLHYSIGVQERATNILYRLGEM